MQNNVKRYDKDSVAGMEIELICVNSDSPIVSKKDEEMFVTFRALRKNQLNRNKRLYESEIDN